MMRLNIKKVSAIAASALMVGMTMGVAAAANYPSPFIVGGTSNVAIVYGTGAGMSTLDVVQAGNIQANLQTYLSSKSSTSTSISGEAVELFTGGTKIYISDAVNKVKSILTKSDLPTILADGSFNGNVDSSYTQTITVGAYPNITYEKQPTSSDDPNLAIKLSSSTNSHAFNMSVTFSKVVNFSHADSEGQDIELFGKTYTVSSSTDNTNLVLLQSASKVSLSSDSPTADVTVAGKAYTISLISASDTSATVSVTDKTTGTSESKEINEAQSKKVNGITVAVTTADENNLKYSASIVAGSEKVTLTSGSNVKVGESDTAILGTSVDFAGGGPGPGLSKMTIIVTAPDSDSDAIKVGGALVDPVFKTVKLGLSGFNIDETSAQREDIKVEPSGDSKMQVTFTDNLGQTKTIRYALYGPGADNLSLAIDDDHHNISVRERAKAHKDEYIMVGNEDEGHILKVSSVYRGISGGSTASGDYLKFTDVMSDAEISATLTANTSTYSTGTVDIGGKRYDVTLEGAALSDSTLYNVSLNYPDSTGNNVIIYPTIQTSKGAKLAFYQPITIPYSTWMNGSLDGNHNLTGLVVPNGADAYETIGISLNGTSGNPDGATGAINVTCGTTVTQLSVFDAATASGVLCTLTNTGFTYNISFSDNPGEITVGLMPVLGTGNSLPEPAVMMYEEKDDNNVYEGLIVTTESGASSEDGIGVDDVQRTWSNDLVWDSVTLASDSKKAKEIDLWGTIILTDTGDSDQAKATISYPDEQVYALVYMGAADSSIGVSGGGGGGALGNVLVTDAEVSSVSSKNLVVVGGSCINSAAATLLGGAYCGSGFTDKTGVGSGQFLIKSFGDAFTSGKIALLVAGYEAADTVNAATYLQNKAVDTTAGKAYKGTSATTAELVTTTV